MNKHTLELLEFKKIVENLQQYCMSELGRKELAGQRIDTEPSEVARKKGITSAFRSLLERVEKFPDLSFPPVEEFYARITAKGTFLEPEELAAIGTYIRSAGKLKEFIGRRGDESVLQPLVLSFPDLEPVAQEIFKYIDKNGQIMDSRIPELVKIKKSIQQLKENINASVKNMINNPQYRNYWQTDTATTRDGRIVLPLKANFKGRIPGIVHEVSSSGATIFLEPSDMVEKNNQVITLENEYRKELVKILRKITVRVAEDFDLLRALVHQISFLDTFYARARYAMYHRCFPAEERGRGLKLINARHPLLRGTVVPIHIALNKGTRVLIITGPNTGGKTVSLKTVALLGIMNQFGMEIPADEGSVLPIFDKVLADIGDEQSIEQSLSTFSGHIRNLSRIIRQSTADSLVLLDELGSGTDPEEGVAIAMALLDHFIEKGCMVFSTTHHGILKNYGYTRAGVENASMDFDDQTLSPRYKVVMGLPGESHALSIAGHNGIPKEIIDNARAYLKDERSDISELIKRLSEKQKQLIETEKEHKSLEMELAEKQRRTDLKELRLRQKEMEITEYSLKELKRFLNDSRKEMENIIRELRESELTKDKIKAVHDYIKGIEETVSVEEQKFEQQIKILYLDDQTDIAPGMQVQVKGTTRRGEVIRRGKGDTWIVKTENLKMTLPSHQLQPLEVISRESKVEVVTTAHESVTQPLFMLNLIGLRREEALQKLQKQIDGAVIKGLKEFNVIHGKGDGILQKGIHEYLKECRFVKDYFFSAPEGGGFGRTIVVMKD